MEDFIIIRGTANGGKTTTAGLLFEKLREKAEFSKVYNYDLAEQNNLEYNHLGNLYDFIGVVVLDGKIIVIISRGDVYTDLEKLLNKLCDIAIINKLIPYKVKKIDVFVCCARSVNRKNSTIRMLYERVKENNRFEFWSQWSSDQNDKLSVKKKVIESIILKIDSL